MIPLDFNRRLNEDEKITIIDEYYEKLTKSRHKSKIKSIDDWCKKYLKIKDDKGNLCKYSFESVVKADFKTLEKIKQYIDDPKNKVNQTELGHRGKDDKLIYYIKDTLYENMGDAKDYLIEQLNITTCPYCNRNFINSHKNIKTCQLDHFFDKSTYPILAVSFYNLIPSCPSCNHRKGTKQLSYSPHDMNYSTDKLLEFSYDILNSDYINNPKSITIDIESLGDKKIDDNISALELIQLYQIHTDIVQELIKKKVIFSEEYINKLEKMFPDVINSSEEVKRLLYGNYLDESEYSKRPLSKLTRDICLQLGIL